MVEIDVAMAFMFFGILVGIYIGYKLKEYESYHFRTKTQRR